MRRSEYLRLFEEGLRKRGFITEASRAEIVKELEAHIVDLIARYPDREEDDLLSELPTPDEMASFMADEMPGKSQTGGNRGAGDEGTEIPIGRGEAGPEDREPPYGRRGAWSDWSDAEYSREDRDDENRDSRFGPRHHGPRFHGHHGPKNGEGGPGNNWQDWEQWRKDWREWKGNWKEWRRQWKDQWKDQWKNEAKKNWSKTWEFTWDDVRNKAGAARESFERNRPHQGYAPWEPGFGEMLNAIFRDVFGPGGGTKDQEAAGTIDLSEIRELDIRIASADLKLSQADGIELGWKTKLKHAGAGAPWQPEVRIEADRAFIDFSGGQNARTVKVALSIPAHLAHLRVEGSSGDVKADDLDQGIGIHIVSGDVKLARCGSFVRIQSTSGEVEIERALGPVDISCESGDVEIETAESDLRVRTSSGDIEAGHAEGRIELESVSGEVSIKHSCCNLGGAVHTVSGDIDLRVGEDMNAEFSIRSNGDVRIDSDVGIIYEDPDDTKRFRVGVGSGGQEVVVESTSGDIRIKA